jgi:hypothetical protein
LHKLTDEGLHKLASVVEQLPRDGGSAGGRLHTYRYIHTEVPDGFALGAGPSDALVLANALATSVPDLAVLAKRLSAAVSASVANFVVLADAATLAFFALALAAVVYAEADSATLPARAPHAVVCADARPFAFFAIPPAEARSVALATELLFLAVHTLGHQVPARGTDPRSRSATVVTLGICLLCTYF